MVDLTTTCCPRLVWEIRETTSSGNNPDQSSVPGKLGNPREEGINPRTDPVLAVVFGAVGPGPWCFSFGSPSTGQVRRSLGRLTVRGRFKTGIPSAKQRKGQGTNPRTGGLSLRDGSPKCLLKFLGLRIVLRAVTSAHALSRNSWEVCRARHKSTYGIERRKSLCPRSSKNPQKWCRARYRSVRNCTSVFPVAADRYGTRGSCGMHDTRARTKSYVGIPCCCRSLWNSWESRRSRHRSAYEMNLRMLCGIAMWSCCSSIIVAPRCCWLLLHHEFKSFDHPQNRF